MKQFKKVQDSGVREEFDTGSRRDTRAGKGRFDLLPWWTINRIAEEISSVEPLAELPMYGLYRLATHFQNGARKYGDRNWEKGQDLCRYLDSAIRHLVKYICKWDDEDHLAAALWNVVCVIETRHLIYLGILPVSLNNLPAEDTWGKEQEWFTLIGKPGDFSRMIEYIERAFKNITLVLSGKNMPEKYLAAAGLYLLKAIDLENEVERGHQPEDLLEMPPTADWFTPEIKSAADKPVEDKPAEAKTETVPAEKCDVHEVEVDGHNFFNLTRISLPNNIHIIYTDKQENIARVFCRFQEYYESPEWADEIFSLEEYREWYKEQKGQWSYYTDWGGFNIPVHTLKPFLYNMFENITAEEQALMQIMTPFWWNAPSHSGSITIQSGYIIGLFNRENILPTLRHELVHAAYANVPEYTCKVNDIINTYSSERLLDEWREKAQATGGYHPKVLFSELNSYAVGGGDSKLSKSVPEGIRGDLINVYTSFLNGRNKKERPYWDPECVLNILETYTNRRI